MTVMYPHILDLLMHINYLVKYFKQQLVNKYTDITKFFSGAISKYVSHIKKTTFFEQFLNMLDIKNYILVMVYNKIKYKAIKQRLNM